VASVTQSDGVPMGYTRIEPARDGAETMDGVDHELDLDHTKPISTGIGEPRPPGVAFGIADCRSRVSLRTGFAVRGHSAPAARKIAAYDAAPPSLRRLVEDRVDVLPKPYL
jgi:hypothetical protein